MRVRVSSYSVSLTCGEGEGGGVVGACLSRGVAPRERASGGWKGGVWGVDVLEKMGNCDPKLLNNTKCNFTCVQINVYPNLSIWIC